MSCARLGFCVVAICALPALPAAAQEVADIVIDDAVDAFGPDFVLYDFDVPAGVVEVEVRHDSVDDSDVIDFGVEDPNGFRGWGGGNSEPAIVGTLAASRSYRPGPIPAGTWRVVVGKAQLNSDAPAVHIEIFLRTTATLPPATDRRAYAPATLSDTARYYAGDLHVHSEDSGDARPPLAEIATFARARGLDFLVITDHNTDSQVDRLGPAQDAVPDVLFVPGVEFTTYGGHATGFGVTRYVDHKLGISTTVDAAVDAIHAQGALFSINHPVLDIGSACIGCAWVHDVSALVARGAIDGVEVATGGYNEAGFLFNVAARDFWDRLLDDGSHAVPVGGSDDHKAGVDLGAFASPIGSPTTLIFAEELSVAALMQGLKDNRVVVKLQGPDDPMIDFQTTPPRTGDTVFSDPSVGDGDITLTAVITGGLGHHVRFMKEGFPDPFNDGVEAVVVDADPFTISRTVRAPPADEGFGEERWRVELLAERDDATGDEGHVQVLTGHVWVRQAEPVVDDGCACASTTTSTSRSTSTTTSASGGAALLLLWGALRRSRRGGPSGSSPAR